MHFCLPIQKIFRMSKFFLSGRRFFLQIVTQLRRLPVRTTAWWVDRSPAVNYPRCGRISSHPTPAPSQTCPYLLRPRRGAVLRGEKSESSWHWLRPVACHRRMTSSFLMLVNHYLPSKVQKWKQECVTWSWADFSSIIFPNSRPIVGRGLVGQRCVAKFFRCKKCQREW